MATEGAEIRHYLIPWKPTAWARPRARVFKGRAQFFTDSKARNAAAAIKIFLIEQRAYTHPREDPVKVVAFFFVPRPQSAPKRVTVPTTRPDIDAYVKLLMDAGTGVLWADDSQVAALEAYKLFAQDGRPRIELQISVFRYR